MELYEIDELFSLYETSSLGLSRIGCEECERLLRNNRIIIYGAGNSGGVLFERLKRIGIGTVAFWDNRGSIYGEQYKGIPVYNCTGINHVVNSNLSYVVIVALFDILSYSNIKNGILESWEGDKERLQVVYFTELREYNELFRLENEPRFSAYLGESPEYIFDHKDCILHVNHLLADEESRLVYKELFNYYLNFDFVDFTVHPFEEHYFDYTIYKRIDDEVFVDCGAYDGDTLDIFLTHNKSFNRYLAIEADGINYSRLKKKVADINPERIQLFNEYVSDTPKEIGFSSYGTSYSNSSNEQERIFTKTLDELVFAYAPTFIKINIEGADLDAIRGSHRIIESYHPIIACQGHHRANHLWEIVEVINEYAEGKYQFFLRNYSGITEFTFYAIPLNRLCIN